MSGKSEREIANEDYAQKIGDLEKENINLKNKVGFLQK
jgi:hypothetical protein